MPQSRRTEIDDLARVLADTVKGVRPARVKLRLIEAPTPTLFDSITRDSCLRRIRFLVRSYQLHWLLEQETFDTPGLDCLSDERLADTLRKMETARECIRDHVSFDDAGLITDTSQKLAHPGEIDHA